MMRRFIRWTLALVVITALWLALVLSEWLPRPTAEEQAALAALAVEPPGAQGERDGFAATWFLGFEVPHDQLEPMLQADIAAYNKTLAETGSVVDFRTTAEGKFATVAAPTSKDPALCELWVDDCLQRVRAAPDSTRQRLQDFAARLERSRGLAQYDHFHFAFTPRFDSPIPGIGGLSNLQLSEAALQYVDGNVDQAFATLCSDTASWRRFRSRSDMLINDMVGIAQMSNAAQIYAQMLAEQPSGFVAPCPEVFAPLTDVELDQCAAMRYEFIASRNSLDAGMTWMTAESPVAQAMHKLLNSQHFVRQVALAVGPYCQPEQRARDASRDASRPAIDARCGAADWIFDPAGCALIESESALPAFHSYHVRVLDLDARLRLLSAAIWLRSQSGTDVAAAFAARPPQLDSAQHAFAWIADQGVLRLRNLEPNRSEFWEVAASMPAATAVPPDAPQ